MNDQVENMDTDETETAPVVIVETDKPKTKALMVKSYVQKGDSVQVKIVPVDAADDTLLEKMIDVAFNELHQSREGEETKIVGRFSATYTRVVDGREDNLVGYAPDAQKAIAQVIKQSGRGTIDDYALEAEFEDDFFKQKIEAPKTDASDIWKTADPASVEALNTLRADVEETLGAIDENTADAEEEATKLAHMLMEANAHPLIKNDRKKLAAWARGGKGGSNMPLLQKLGSGVNALTEAMRIAQLSDTENAVRPRTTLSGKAIDRLKSLAVKAVVDNGAIAYGAAMKDTTFSVIHKGLHMPDVEGTAVLLRMIASRAYEFDATEGTLSDVSDAVDVAALEKAADYSQNYGKTVNVYDTAGYDAAKMAFGRVTVSRKGSTPYFDNAIKTLIEIDGTDFDTKDGLQVALYGLYTGNLMLKHALQVAFGHRETLIREKTNRELMKETNMEDGPISKAAVKVFAKLPPLASAAHLFKLLETHPEAPAVWEHLKSLVTQNGVKKPAPDA